MSARRTEEFSTGCSLGSVKMMMPEGEGGSRTMCMMALSKALVVRMPFWAAKSWLVGEEECALSAMSSPGVIGPVAMLLVAGCAALR